MPGSVLSRLQKQPGRFRFDAAVRVLTHARRQADPAEAVRFRSAPGLAYVPADVTDVAPGPDGQPPRMTVGVMGLTGTTGVLPRFYTEALAATLRNRSRALHDFLDALSHRFVALFARAGAKYRLNRAAERPDRAARPDKVSQALLSLTGYGTPHLAPRLAAGTDPLLHYAGLFAMRPRSADRLAALVSDWLGRKVEVRQFAGAWLPLPPDQRTALAVGRRAGAWNRLGVDAAAGVRAWDVQARIILRIGPLDRAGFERLLPDRPGLHRLVSLVRAYLGFETGFAINPVLRGPDVPPLLLDPKAATPVRLGWNSWMPGPAPAVPGIARPDAAEAVFEAEVVEAQQEMAERRG